MALDWQEGGPNPSASPTASLAAILGQIPTGLTQPWPPPVLLCALAVLLPSPLCSLLQILAGSGPQSQKKLLEISLPAAVQLQAPPPSGWTHSSGATDAPEWRAVVRIGDLLRGAVCSRVHVGALGATHDANMVRPRAPLECNLLLLHTPALSVLRTGLLTVAWRCRVAPGFGVALASGGPIGGLKGCGRGAAVTGVRQAHRRAGTVATGANSVSMLLEGSLVECVGAGVIKVRALPRCTCPRRSP